MGGVFRSENSGLTHFKTDGTSKEVSAYKMFINDLLPFVNGFTLTWRNGDTTTADGVKCTTQSHEHVAAGMPTEANVTTLTWFYEFGHSLSDKAETRPATNTEV